MNYFQEHKRNFKQIINTFVGSNGQPYTVASLSTISGLSKGTIRSHLDDFGSLPTLPHLLVYMKIFDTAFADAVVSYAGLSVCRADEHEAPTTHHAQLALAQLMKEIIEAFQDGTIDAAEKKKLSPILRETGQLQIALANSYEDELKEKSQCHSHSQL